MIKNISIIAGSFLLIALFFSISMHLFDKEKFTHSEPTWTCEYQKKNWQCNVSFNIKSNSHVKQNGSLAIRGMALRGSSKNGSVQIGDQKRIEFCLSGYQEKEIVEIIYMNKKPTFVNITFLK